MAAPEPDNPLPPQNILKSLIEAFKGLPPLLSFGGLMYVVGFFVLYATGNSPPPILLLVPLVALVGYLILQARRQELEHKEKMTHPEQSQPAPREVVDGSAVERDDVSAEEWERRYLDHLMGLCKYPPSMALIDIKEAGLGGHKLALDQHLHFTGGACPAGRAGLVAPGDRPGPVGRRGAVRERSGAGHYQPAGKQQAGHPGRARFR